MSRPQTHAIVIAAPAKLNLALAVAPPEPPTSPKPGWHRIASWMHAVELAGSVSLRKAGASSLSRAWAADTPWATPLDWPIKRDLAWRALKLLEEHVARPLPAAIALTKRTPVGGGMGGGSSEAAAVLMGLNRLYELGLSRDDLASLSAHLGSDIAFFIDDVGDQGSGNMRCRSAIVNRFGECINRTEPQSAGVVLIVPPFGSSTPAVYRAFDSDAPKHFREDAVGQMAKSPPDAQLLFNDLTEAACRVEPRIAALMKAASVASGKPVQLTGSGSVLFVLCAEGEQTDLAAKLAPACRPAAVVTTRLT